MIGKKRLRFLQILSFLSMLWFAYWIFPFEMIVGNKTLVQALGTNLGNNILFVASISFLVFISSNRLRKYLPKIPFHPPNWFRRKSKVQKAWGSTGNERDPVVSSQTMVVPTFQPITVKKPRKLRVSGLRTVKRGIAGLMLLVNLLLALSGLAFSGLLALLFFLNVFILLDYLHKTKKIKDDWREEAKK